MDLTVRPATPDDVADVVAFTRDTWSDRRGDYLPRVFERWVATDDPDTRTFVADADGRAVGCAQMTMLSAEEAWAQGLRVDPDFRGRDVGSALSRAGFAWARERGATVARGMVFSWNVAGLGHSRANGFDPATEFRFVHPAPDPDATPDLAVVDDPADAWRFWTTSDAREHLGGLALDDGESWALSELTRPHLGEAADDGHLLVVRDGGTRGLSHLVREYDRPTEGSGEEMANENADPDTERWAEYGVGAWADPDACRALFRAIERDAGDRGVDRVRVLVPETARCVSDVAAARVPVADEPDFVLAADLTDESVLG